MGIRYCISRECGIDVPGGKGIYTSVMFLDGLELYSGGENDPVTMAHMNADYMARDEWGRALPYDVTISVFACGSVDRDRMLVEDICPMRRRITQKIGVHLVVFKDLWSYERYMEEENCLINQE